MTMLDGYGRTLQRCGDRDCVAVVLLELQSGPVESAHCLRHGCYHLAGRAVKLAVTRPTTQTAHLQLSLERLYENVKGPFELPAGPAVDKIGLPSRDIRTLQLSGGR